MVQTQCVWETRKLSSVAINMEESNTNASFQMGLPVLYKSNSSSVTDNLSVRGRINNTLSGGMCGEMEAKTTTPSN